MISNSFTVKALAAVQCFYTQIATATQISASSLQQDNTGALPPDTLDEFDDSVAALPEEDDLESIEGLADEQERPETYFPDEEKYAVGVDDHSCTYSIERSIIGPYDYKRIIGSGEPFEDSKFNPNTGEQIHWSDFPRVDRNNLKSHATKYLSGFMSPKEKDENASLFGEKIDPYDIHQGNVGDCYFLACAAAIAEYPERLKKIFLIDELNEEGIVPFKVFIKGRPEVITTDDKIPHYKSGNLYAKPSRDGAWWVPLLEKMYAKVNVNYESIGWGWMSESMQILTGAPSKLFTSGKLSTNALWDIIDEADD